MIIKTCLILKYVYSPILCCFCVNYWGWLSLSESLSLMIVSLISMKMNLNPSVSLLEARPHATKAVLPVCEVAVSHDWLNLGCVLRGVCPLAASHLSFMPLCFCNSTLVYTLEWAKTCDFRPTRHPPNGCFSLEILSYVTFDTLSSPFPLLTPTNAVRGLCPFASENLNSVTSVRPGCRINFTGLEFKLLK